MSKALADSDYIYCVIREARHITVLWKPKLDSHFTANSITNGLHLPKGYVSSVTFKRLVTETIANLVPTQGIKPVLIPVTNRPLPFFSARNLRRITVNFLESSPNSALQNRAINLHLTALLCVPFVKGSSSLGPRFRITYFEVSVVVHEQRTALCAVVFNVIVGLGIDSGDEIG